jgi:hypothetical protein
MNSKLLLSSLTVAAALGVYHFAPPEGFPWRDREDTPQRTGGEIPQPIKENLAAANPTNSAVRVTNPLAHLKPDDFSEVAVRPLFSAERRPPRPATAEVAVIAPVSPEPDGVVEPVNPADFMLVAVSSDGTGKVAIVKQISTNQTFYAREGDDILGMEVTSIENRRIELRSEGSSYPIGLFEAKTDPSGPENSDPPETPPNKPLTEDEELPAP